MHPRGWAVSGLLALIGAGCGTGPETLDTPLPGQSILAAAEVPWETLEGGWRRKVIFSGGLTLVLIEAPGPSTGPIELHHHVHDQIAYVIEGEIDVQVGEEVRRIGAGGFYRIPSEAPHGIRILSPQVRLIDVFSPPREDFRRVSSFSAEVEE